MKRLLTVLLTLLIVNSTSVYGDEFQVSDIRIEGLQRVSAGTVFAALPINVGDLADDASIRQATRSLFRTGYFADVIMARENGILVIGLIERPAVTEINIEGNKAIETDQLMDALRDNGLAEGQIFRQVILEGMSQELQRQYVSQGRYGALVQTEVKDLPRNRVSVNIDIDEGDVAKIRHINIVGNNDFVEQDLLDQFEQNETGWLSWITSDDKYSREKLSGDLETLESWYLDRGYLKFEVLSTQVSISPDKESVFITINIDEGDVYTISGIELAGDLIISEAEALGKKVEATSVKIVTKAGEKGKIFGSVNTIQLSEALKAEGIDIDRKSLKIKDEPIREVGSYEATANLHKEVKAEIKFEVVGE